MSRSTLYNILRDKIIKEEYLNAIRKAGYDFDSFVQTNVHDKIIQTTPSKATDFEKENIELKKLLAEKQKIIDTQERIIIWQEHFFKKSRKSFAQATHPTKNKN